MDHGRYVWIVNGFVFFSSITVDALIVSVYALILINYINAALPADSPFFLIEVHISDTIGDKLKTLLYPFSMISLQMMED